MSACVVMCGCVLWMVMTLSEQVCTTCVLCVYVMVYV